jgi:hopanoid biosynthesis associated radical SAM protein HpnH
MWTVASYVVRQRSKGVKRYPLVLMLEPLVRCNLACAGCGKTQYPAHVLRRQLSVEECLHAVAECGAPIVSIPGGEPLLHPDMPRLVRELIARKKYIYLCTNAMILKEKINDYRPDKHFTFSVHLDGLEQEHDASVRRPGMYQKAVAAIKEAIGRGFRVTTNTTVFEGAAVQKLRRFFDTMMALGVEGMMVSPGYNYEKAPCQELFLQRERSRELFRQLLYKPSPQWKFNQSPLFLEFLAGSRHFDCMPWGTPTYNIFGWQVPCYLLQEGYVETYGELMEKTDWQAYGEKSGKRDCAHCMVHSGYEPSAVNCTFGSWEGFYATVRATLFGPKILPPAPAETPGNAEHQLGQI